MRSDLNGSPKWHSFIIIAFQGHVIMMLSQKKQIYQSEASYDWVTIIHINNEYSKFCVVILLCVPISTGCFISWIIKQKFFEYIFFYELKHSKDMILLSSDLLWNFNVSRLYIRKNGSSNVSHLRSIWSCFDPLGPSTLFGPFYDLICH